MVLKVKRIHTDAKLPTRGTPHSAGLDLYLLEGLVVHPGETKKVPLGIQVAIPEGHVGLIHARSSAFLKGAEVDGVVDSDFRGEVHLMIRSNCDRPVVAEAGSKIAQMVVVPVASLVVEEAFELPATVRGEGGFGSSGK